MPEAPCGGALAPVCGARGTSESPYNTHKEVTTETIIEAVDDPTRIIGSDFAVAFGGGADAASMVGRSG